MNKKNKRMLLPLLAIILLVVQMMNPVPVYADGETPPDPPATEETPPPEEQTDSTEETPSTEVEAKKTPSPEDATPTEEPSAEATPSPKGDETTETPPAEETGTLAEPTETEETPASEPTEEPAPDTEVEAPPQEDLTVAEVLEQAPDGTEVVVLNQEGQVEPLVTEAAAEIAANADPIWCPDGVAPIANTGGCSDSFTSMTDMINWLVTYDPNRAGTIWIEDGYDSASEGVAGFTLDGSSFTNLDNNALTVQGGWDGNNGSTAITGTSTFNGDYLHITNWNANVTLMDILEENAWSNGILVTTSGTVTLEDVKSNKNDGNGLLIVTDENIALNNVTASENTNGVGALLNTVSGTGNVTLTGTNIFNENAYGIAIFSAGDVNLTGVTANQNSESGIYASIYNASAMSFQNSTLGSSLAAGNGNDGMEVYTDGSVVIQNVTAIGNVDNGVKVYADYGDGDLTVFNSTFSENGDEGLEGRTDTGAINITNVFANQNAQFGLLLESYEGDITLDNVTANMNGYDGADLYSAIGSLNIFTGQFNGNDEFGLWLEAGFEGFGGGDITLNNVTANTNGLGGAVLQVEDGNINVFTGQFNGNVANAVPDCGGGECSYYPPDGGIGLAAASWGGIGQIYLENVQAWNNYGDGAWLEGDDVVVRNSTFHFNCLGQASLGSDDLYADGLYISDLGGSSAYLECVQANGNAAFGIDIYTGDIVLNGVTAAGNGWDDFHFESDTLSIFNKPCREPKDNTDTSWQIVPVSGGTSVGLNCTAYVGTVLVLPNGDEIRLPCPTIGEGNLEAVADNGLPGDLPDGNDYVSSFTAQVIQGGVSLETLPASMIVSFVIPEEMLDAELSILYWNGSEWVEVAGAYKTTDNRFEASVNYTGVFVLVSK